MQILRGKRTGCLHLAVSPDSRFLACGGYLELHVWDLHNPKAKPARAAGETAHHYAFVADGRLFAAYQNEWRLYDPATGHAASWHPPNPAPSYRAAVISPDGRHVLERGSDDGLALWRLVDEGQELRRELVWSRPWSEYGVGMFMPDSERFLLSRRMANTPGQPWAAYRTGDAERLAGYRLRGAMVYSMTVSPDGARLLHAVNARVYAWDAHAGGDSRLLTQHPAKKHFRNIGVHPSGAVLAGVMSDDTVAFFDVANGGLLRSYEWNIGKLQHVAFTPDGTRCAVAGTTGKILVFDVE